MSSRYSLSSCRVLVATESALKIQAVENVFKTVFHKSTVEIHCVKAASGINEQPAGHDETLLGASNRLEHAKTLAPPSFQYDYVVSIENGIYSVKDPKTNAPVWFDEGWVIIEERTTGNRVLSVSNAVKLPTEYVEAARAKGFNTTTVGSLLAQINPEECPNKADPHSFLTKKYAPRQKLLEQALLTALSQLL
eukprot:GEZU01022002.1.p1 GENE.GEZU01022002.1~~GEZU01022002.1.p1  ORF type:complete len:193 (-),score=35.22 GEZU01022002.1:594-1172(-)